MTEAGRAGVGADVGVMVVGAGGVRQGSGGERRGVVDNLRGIVDKNRSKSINFVCIVACSCREAATADMIINFCSISAIYLIS